MVVGVHGAKGWVGGLNVLARHQPLFYCGLFICLSTASGYFLDVYVLKYSIYYSVLWANLV